MCPILRPKFRSTLNMEVITLTLLLVAGTADAQTFTPPTPLSVLYEVNVGNGSYTDFMTTANASERDEFPLLGQIAYIQADPNLAPLYRLWNLGYDHMDSQTPGEGGYSTEGALGSPWSSLSAEPGLSPITRLFNPSTGDHATTVPVTLSLYNGYQSDSNLGGRYGYQRFGYLSSAIQLYSAGGVTEGSDTVAGGAVASWTWNGLQFIDTNDYGRYMQADVFVPVGNTTFNPIEAGDAISGPSYGPVDKWHGSPILQNQVTNGVHITRAIPLEYGLPGSGGYPVTVNTPAVYSGMQIGKNLTLNFDGLGPVGQYQTVFYTPTPLNSATAEIPTAYLAAGVFTNFFTYDGKSNALQAAYPPNGCTASTGLPYTPPSGRGGVIISNASGSYAMGIYGRSKAKGKTSVAYYGLWDFRACGGVTKWSAVFTGNMPAGQTIYTTYVVTGTLSSVVQDMYTLYHSGH